MMLHHMNLSSYADRILSATMETIKVCMRVCFQIILCQVERKKRRKEIGSYHATSTFMVHSMRQFGVFSNTVTKLESVLIFLSFLFQSMPQCRDLLLHCSWQSQEIDCLRLFKVMTTDDGFCCLFNAYKQGDVMKEMNLT